MWRYRLKVIFHRHLNFQITDEMTSAKLNLFFFVVKLFHFSLEFLIDTSKRCAICQSVYIFLLILLGDWLNPLKMFVFCSGESPVLSPLIIFSLLLHEALWNPLVFREHRSFLVIILLPTPSFWILLRVTVLWYDSTFSEYSWLVWGK